MPNRREAYQARRAKEREERLQKEAEEALLLAQYLRRKNAEAELKEQREAKRLKEYLSQRA